MGLDMQDDEKDDEFETRSYGPMSRIRYGCTHMICQDPLGTRVFGPFSVGLRKWGNRLLLRLF